MTYSSLIVLLLKVLLVKVQYGFSNCTLISKRVYVNSYMQLKMVEGMNITHNMNLIINEHNCELDEIIDS